jgi:quercetin dioxygenase-like cupin family protein
MTQIIAGTKTVFSIDPAILELLPTQGSVELQRDAAGKVHHFHTHPVNEILVIISGTLNFVWEGGERICGAGDTIILPAGKLHQSETLDDGAVHAIATRPLAVPTGN